MDHVRIIKKLIKTVKHSTDFHGCIIEGPSGWGKTTSTEEALNKLKVSYVCLGAYSTPLNLFNFLSQNPEKIILLDDVSGIFSSFSAMAILKSATWPRHSGQRVITWGSTSLKANVEEFVFTGKILIICNAFPKTPDSEAIRSRCLSWKIKFSESQISKALLNASTNKNFFKKTNVATNVVKYLISRMDDLTHNISYRTLKMGYEVALHNRDWEDLLSQMMPKKENPDPVKVIFDLASENLPVEKQCVEFERRTGLKRRSFYKFRRELDLSRPYKDK